MPVGALVESMTYWEWLHWMAREAITPGGETRQDMRMALLTSEFVNTQIPSKRDKTTPERYMIGRKLLEAARERYERATASVLTPWADKKAKFFANLNRVLKKD